MGKRYTAVRKLTDNPYLNLYEMDARTKTGKAFSYYFASREQEAGLKINTAERKASGLAVFGITREAPHRLLMIRQYRYPMGEYLYEVPAGLIEPGETEEEAAIRELKEETGLDLTVCTQGEQGFRRPFYLAQGISDELDSTVFGYVDGQMSAAGLEDSEDISVQLVDQKEARRILREEPLSLRAGYLLMLFLNLSEEKPFSFLEQ